jgi:hypothetical protein
MAKSSNPKRCKGSAIVIPADYTVWNIQPVDGAPLLDIDFDTDSGDPTVWLRLNIDTASDFAEVIQEFLYSEQMAGR